MSKLNGDHASQIQPDELTAYALGQLHGERLAAVKAAVGNDAHSPAGGDVRGIQSLAAAIQAARNAEPLPEASVELRTAVEARLKELAASDPAVDKLAEPAVELPAQRRRWDRRWIVGGVLAGGLCCVLAALSVPMMLDRARPVASTFDRIGPALPSTEGDRSWASATTASAPVNSPPADNVLVLTEQAQARPAVGGHALVPDTTDDEDRIRMVTPRIVVQEEQSALGGLATPPAEGPDPPSAASVASSESELRARAEFFEKVRQGQSAAAIPQGREDYGAGASAGYGGGMPGGSSQAGGLGGYGGYGGYPGGPAGMGMPGSARGSGGVSGMMGAGGHPGGYPGDRSGGGKYGAVIVNNGVPGTASDQVTQLAEVDLRQGGAGYQLSGSGQPGRTEESELQLAERTARESKAFYDGYYREEGRGYKVQLDSRGGEQYESIVENAFLSPLADPLSTFSVDVDTASYANVRRFLNSGALPPPAAVRIEELVNYFSYSYPQPTGKEPFSVHMEAAECPWNAGHVLLRVGLKGKEVHRSERPPSNLTFLLDVSGSMQDENKLPLLKSTLLMLVAELTENDRVSIVTYAGEAGLRLPPTRGNEKQKIMAAIESLSAGGSTHGSAGIQLAYEQAGQYFLKEGTNRVILATDGDLNVGVTSDDALVELIKQKAVGGTFLTVLGFGTGNLKDGKLEKLADNGNGVYAYIDSMREGRKVLVEQMSGNLVTIAKDVKIQIEFNPAQIASYRLLGYENRVLAAADFSNDKKDAGEIGAGHTVTALYELVPVGKKDVAAAVQVGEPLKYQRTEDSGQRTDSVGPHGTAVGSSALRGVPGDVRLSEAAGSGELLTLKLRYKQPDGVESRMIEFPLKDRGGSFHSASKDLQFAAAVASFGMILRGSEHRGSGSLLAVAEIAAGALGDDASGHRAEFVDLVRKAQAMGAK